MSPEAKDQHFLKLALEEAQKSMGPHKYGALIVKDGEAVAIDHNRVRELNDPSAHAEILIIKQVCKEMGTYNLPSGCTLYASHESCIMCFCCAAWAKLDRMVFAYPASNEGDDSYEFRSVNIFEMNKKLLHPMKVDHIQP